MSKRSMPRWYHQPPGPLEWLEFPDLLSEESCLKVVRAFGEQGVVFRVRQIRREVVVYAVGERWSYSVFIRADHARIACRELARVFQLTDPGQDASWTGACPTCGCQLVHAQRCSRCGLNFVAGASADDGRVAFICEHGGFDDE